MELDTVQRLHRRQEYSKVPVAEREASNSKEARVHSRDLSGNYRATIASIAERRNVSDTVQSALDAATIMRERQKIDSSKYSSQSRSQSTYQSGSHQEYTSKNRTADGAVGSSNVMRVRPREEVSDSQEVVQTPPRDKRVAVSNTPTTMNVLSSAGPLTRSPQSNSYQSRNNNQNERASSLPRGAFSTMEGMSSTIGSSILRSSAVLNRSPSTFRSSLARESQSFSAQATMRSHINDTSSGSQYRRKVKATIRKN